MLALGSQALMIGFNEGSESPLGSPAAKRIFVYECNLQKNQSPRVNFYFEYCMEEDRGKFCSLAYGRCDPGSAIEPQRCNSGRLRHSWDKHTCPASSSRHLAALAKPLVKANAARTSLFCHCSCHCSCHCCCSGSGAVRPLSRDILCRDWVPPLIAAALPRISSRPEATPSTSCCPKLASRLAEPAQAPPRNINNVDIGWDVCWFLLKYVLIFVEINVVDFNLFQ